jgi:hypothetical protein
MKLLSLITILFISNFTNAEECIFDETSYQKFIMEYAATHQSAKLQDDNSLFIQGHNETILVTGGGCDHLGGSIVVTGNTKFNQSEFFDKLLALSEEYASWLINSSQLQSAIKDKHWNLDDGFYRINLDEMTVFEALQDDDGKIEISFYIN